MPKLNSSVPSNLRRLLTAAARRRTLAALAVTTLLTAAALSLTAAGSSAAPFAFMDSVRGFFGTVPVLPRLSNSNVHSFVSEFRESPIAKAYSSRFFFTTTPYPMNTGDYAENFSDIANWTDNFASGTGANRWQSVAVNSTGTIPDGVKTTVSTATFQTSAGSGGMQRGSLSGNVAGTLVFLSTGTTSNGNSLAADLFLDFTGRNAGTLSFDWAEVSNSTGNRGATLKVYTSTDGSTWTELVSASTDVVNNVASSGTKSALTLPASFNNSSTSRIRFYEYANAVGTTGSRPKISIDNVAVTSTSAGNTAPIVTSSAASSITTTSATLNGNVTSDGGAAVTDRGFVYKTSSGVTISDNKTVASEGANGTGTISLSLSSLGVNTQYFFKSYAINTQGTTLSTPELSFWTLANVPNVPTVGNPTQTTLDVAIGSGDGNPSGTVYAIQEAGGQYVQAGGALGASAVYQTAAAWGTKTVTNLNSNTTYTFKVKAQNGAGTDTAFGSTAGAMTSPGAPTVTSSAASSVTTTSATLNGNVVADGGASVTDRGFVYKSTAGVTIGDNKTVAAEGASGTGAITLAVSSLGVNTQLFFKAYATNTAGTTLSTPELSFYTLANTPTTPTVGSPTTNTLSVTLGSGDGNPSTTAYAIQEQSSGNYVQANGTLGASAVYQTASTWGTQVVSGLASATTFTFKVKAKNGDNVDTAFSSTATGHTLGSTLVAGWDFQTTSNGGTAAAAAPNSPTVFAANFGTGNIYLDGTNGSSTFVTATSGNELTSFGGTAVNLGSGFSSDTTGASALAVQNSTANSKFIVFKFSMSGRKNLSVSYATRNTSTGFTTQTWEYSTDGSSWTAAGAITGLTTSYAAKSLGTITGLNNSSTAYLRLTLTGATDATGNNRLDNIQLIASDFYTVAYDANGGTGTQTDANSPYTSNASVTVLGPTESGGTIARTGYTFTGWNTLPGGTGNSYATGNTFFITGNTTLYAQWLDNIAPDTIIDTNPANPSNSASASFTFHGTDAGSGVASFECDLDGGGFSACTSAKNYSSLSEGSHTFQVRAKDVAGNTDGSPASFTWTIDLTAPVITYTPIANTALTSAQTTSVTVTDAVAVGSVSVFYSINGGSFTSAGCSSTGGTAQNGTYDCTIPGQSTGTSVAYYVRAADTAGNIALKPSGGASAPNLYTVGNAPVPAGTYTDLSLSDGASLGGDIVVNGVLTLGGTVTTGSFTLELGCSATVSGAGGYDYVVGNVKKDFCGAGTFSFPVGTTPNGSRPAFDSTNLTERDAPDGSPNPPEYTPLSMTVNSGTFPAAVTVAVTDLTMPGLDTAKSVSRYWDVSVSGGPINADMTFNYLAGTMDVPATATEADFKVYKNDGATITEVTSTAGTQSKTVAGVTSFSKWGIGILAPTAAPAVVSGRVVTWDGRGIQNAIITATDLSGQPVGTVITGPFGYYSVGGLEVGQTYVLTVSSKRYRFASPSRIVGLVDDVVGFDFVANP